MSRPTAPTVATLDRVEQYLPGSAKRLLDEYFVDLADHRSHVVASRAAEDRERSKLWRYRNGSVFCGMSLGVLSLAVIALAIFKGSNLAELGVALAPVAGIAGVFVWGYAPAKPVAGETAATKAATKAAAKAAKVDPPAATKPAKGK